MPGGPRRTAAPDARVCRPEWDCPGSGRCVHRSNRLYKEIQTPLSNKVFLKFFGLDENYINSLAKHKLKIQVFNDDNNFTNGFLTKSTFIALRVASIIDFVVVLYLFFLLIHWPQNKY